MSTLNHLNPPQREAVLTTEGPVLVIAGPGSGKTRVIAHRIGHLIGECGAKPWEIFASTFTNKAAREMKDRVLGLLETPSVKLSISTFHAFGAMTLRREAEHAGLSPRFLILDDSDQKAVAKSCLERLKIDSKSITPSQALDRVSQAKIHLLRPEASFDLFDGVHQSEYVAFYQEYEEMLRRNDAVDFDDLLMRVVRLFETNAEVLARHRDRFKYLMVDEYQDTNQAQFRIVELLAREHRNICVVGDEDQSIYSWRGAQIQNILDFQTVFAGAKVIRLEQNYRSTKNVLHIAEAVISRNTQRMGKALLTDNPAGPPATVYAGATAQGEAAFIAREIARMNQAEGIALNEMAVFFRVNALSRVVEDALRGANIPYRVLGGLRFYDRMEIKDALAYLQVVASPSSNLAMARIVNKPKRGIGDKTLQSIEAWSRSHAVPLSEAMVDKRAVSDLPKKAAAALALLGKQFEVWREKAEKLPVSALMQTILTDIGYRESLGDQESLEAITRWQNVEELLASIKEFEERAESTTLLDYLEQVALTATADDGGGEEDAVSLMSLHSAKGLEFEAVFLIGLEDDIFPSPRAAREAGNIEEERRLFYVGVTRAKERLYLTWAKTRALYGRMNYTTPSIFIHETPDEFREDDAEDERRGFDDYFAKRMPRRSAAMPAGDLDYPPPQAKKPSRPSPPQAFHSTLKAGQYVEHIFLGKGQVLGFKGEGDARKVVVAFDDGGMDEILERYGDLKVVD